MLKNFLFSLNYEDKLHFQNQYSERTGSSPGEEAQQQSWALGGCSVVKLSVRAVEQGSYSPDFSTARL